MTDDYEIRTFGVGSAMPFSDFKRRKRKHPLGFAVPQPKAKPRPRRKKK